MGRTKEQVGKPTTEEDVVRIRPYAKPSCVVLMFVGEHAEEARAAYDAYVGSLSLEGGEAADLIHQNEAEFARLTGLSAPRIRDLVTQKQEELNKRAGD